MKNKEKKKKSKLEYCFGIIILLAVFICIIIVYSNYEKKPLKESNLDSWIGEYKFPKLTNAPEEPFMIVEIEKKLSKESNLDSWIGVYTFSESTDASEGPFMVMNYEIKIYKEEQYYADIMIDGQTTLARAKAELHGDEEWIILTFLEYLPENIAGIYAEKNDVLISFRRDNQKLYTYWGEIVPMMYDNEESGEIYFQKEN